MIAENNFYITNKQIQDLELFDKLDTLIKESDLELRISEEKLFENINKLLPVLRKYKINDIDFRNEIFKDIKIIYFFDSKFYYKDNMLYVQEKQDSFEVAENENIKDVYESVSFTSKHKIREDLISFNFIDDRYTSYILKKDNISFKNTLFKCENSTPSYEILKMIKELKYCEASKAEDMIDELDKMFIKNFHFNDELRYPDNKMEYPEYKEYCIVYEQKKILMIDKYNQVKQFYFKNILKSVECSIIEDIVKVSEKQIELDRDAKVKHLTSGINMALGKHTDVLLFIKNHAQYIPSEFL